MRYYLGELRLNQEESGWVKAGRKVVEWFLVFSFGAFVGYLWMAKAYGLF